jgi:dGTPase
MNLTPYATKAENSKGRLFKEDASEYRDCFQRDRDRIIHSSAFRRLEYKTQVFVNFEGDYFRTRLTHSLEVAQLARTIGRSLNLNEDLIEACALAHDLGHPPFGHAGEDALDEVMQKYGGFDHNAHTLKILTKLEQKYGSFDGLNISWETLEGIVKHNGPLVKNRLSLQRHLPKYITEYNKKHDLDLHKYSSLEAQIASLADDIAYNIHDVDDGLQANILDEADFTQVRLLDNACKHVKSNFRSIEKHRFRHEMLSVIYGIITSDLIRQTKQNLQEYKITTSDEIRNLGKPTADFSTDAAKDLAELKAFLHEKMYSHYLINRMKSKAHKIVSSLFNFYMENPDCLTQYWQRKINDKTGKERAEIICDFIAGMTDRFAIKEYKSIFHYTDEENMFR